jgi:WD40 repeat protein
MVAAFSPDGAVLATANPYETRVRLWDAAAGTALRDEVPAPPGAFDMVFSPDGTLIATAGEDGSVTIWDRQPLRRRGVFQTEGRAVWALAFSPDGRRLATGGKDGALRLWDMATVLGGLSPAGQ